MSAPTAPPVAAGPATSAAGTPRPSVVLDSLLLAGRHLLLMVRRPSSIIGAIVLPIMFALLFFTIFGRIMERAGMDFAQYLLPAIIMQAVFFSAMSGSVWAAEDASSGMAARLRAMPISRSAPVASLIVGETTRGLIGSAILVGIGYTFGFRLETGFTGALAMIGLIIAASVAIILPFLVLAMPPPTRSRRRPSAASSTSRYCSSPPCSSPRGPTRAGCSPSWRTSRCRGSPRRCARCPPTRPRSRPMPATR